MAVEHLDLPALMRLRDYVIERPGRGVNRRCARTINNELVPLGTMLRDWRRRGLLPRVSVGDIADSMRRLRVERGVVEVIHPPALRQLLLACLRHDAATFAVTRDDRARGVVTGEGATARYAPIAPFVLAVLLTGMRVGEAVALTWEMVNLDAAAIALPPSVVKTGEGRRIDLDCSPALVRLLAALRQRSGGTGSVFGLTRAQVDIAHKRLSRFGAPAGFTYQKLRRTCGSVVACGSIYGEAGVWRAAQRLGHSVSVAERRYYRTLSVDASAMTIEGGMGIAELADQTVDATIRQRPDVTTARPR